MDLRRLQITGDQWIQRNGRDWDQFQILARLTEELGEIAPDLQRQTGLRPRKMEGDLQGEVGDPLFTLAALANVTDVDLSQAIAKTLAKYDLRDAQDWQGTTRA